MKDVERFTIEYRFDRDPSCRLRGLLKVALRRFGLRCVRVDVKPAAMKPLSRRRAPRSVACGGDGCSPNYTCGPTKARGELNA